MTGEGDISALEAASSLLAGQVKALVEAVDVARTLRDEIVQLRTYGSRSRAMILSVIVGLVLDMALTLGAGLLFLRQRDLNTQVASVQRGLAAGQRATDATVAAAAARAASTCHFFFDFGTISLPAASGRVAFQIIADSRNAYVQSGCQFGRLPRPDPRLLPFLIPSAK
jgi:hypothetical protein